MTSDKIASAKKFYDQLGREIRIPFPPKRIISLVPSQTELLYDLGLDQEIVGITKFCIHPHDKCKTKAKVGGTKNININKINILVPDLIIANKEENDELQIKELIKSYPVWISDIKTLNDAYRMMETVGEMVNRKDKMIALVEQIKLEILNNQALQKESTSDVRNAVYLIWRHPYIVVGNDTFINTMVEVAGFTNVFIDKIRYPEITIDQLKERSPHYILLSSEPFPFKEKHQVEFQAEFPDSKVLLVDGEMFSWYGSHLLKAPSYFSTLRN
jgi:ABC-type Fe3+-hydroxamate transport system substrate-binding protein